MKTLLIAILSLIFSVLTITSQIRILTIGDSTMADYDLEKYSGEKEQRGWAQLFPLYLNDDVKLDNEARNGRSSKSFFYERWTELKETINEGDYVIIQFGHNDEKNDGEDTDENDPTARGTNPWSPISKIPKDLYRRHSHQRRKPYFSDSCSKKNAKRWQDRT